MQARSESATCTFPFASFWQAGFEGADHVNGSGRTLAMAELSGHLRHIDADYAALAEFDIRTVRESAGWRHASRGRDYDFASVVRRAEAAQRHGLQILWTCCHCGVPPGIDLFDPAFPGEFAR